MRFGICGGTFDPFHRGHIDPILAVRESMGWDRVIYVPARVQPFKQDRHTASAYHRHAMAVLGTEEHDGLDVSIIELERDSVSYTVDTLQELRRTYPSAVFDWIIGDDNLEQLGEWKAIDTIFELANFVVLTRTGGMPPPPADPLSEEDEEPLAMRVCGLELQPSQGAIMFVQNDIVAASSTEVRRRLREGESVDHLVVPRVARYIQHYQLYGKGPS